MRGLAVAALERLNGFATRERNELAEHHSRAERRLQTSILRRPSQRTHVDAIFVGQQLHRKQPARRLGWECSRTIATTSAERDHDTRA